MTDDRAHRGMVTAAQHAEGRKVAVPVIINRQPPPLAERGEVTRFVTNRARFHYIKITTLRGETAADLRARPPRDTEDEALVRAALVHQPDGRIFFNDYAFGTSSRSVAAYLDARIRQGRLPGVARDSEQMRLRCTFCNHTEMNTELGREKLLRHTIDAHPGADGDTWEDAYMSHETRDDTEDYDPTQGDRGPTSKASAVPTGDLHTAGDPADNDAAEDAFHAIPQESVPFGAAERAQVRDVPLDQAPETSGQRPTPEPAGPPAPPERVKEQVAAANRGPTGATAAESPNYGAMKKDELIAELEKAGLNPDDYSNNEERAAALEKRHRRR